MERREFLAATAAVFLLSTRMSDKTANRAPQTCLWRPVASVGLERFLLVEEQAGWSLRGTILRLSNGMPAEVHYVVLCDRSWQTRHADIRLLLGEQERSLVVDCENAHWYMQSREIDFLRGSVDVDLAWTPSTNTLPIRRLNLRVGERSGPITAAWIQFPELRITPLPQEYTRIADREYRYTSRSGAFSAAIEVDDAGIVIEYQNGWQRVSEANHVG